MKRSSFGRKAPPARPDRDVAPAPGGEAADAHELVRVPFKRAEPPPKPGRADAAKPKIPDHKLAAQRAVLSALRKARRAAIREGVDLTPWEDAFLGSVAERVQTYGRAFADAEKGDPDLPLSVLQAVKLKEITKKAKGEKKRKGRKDAANSAMNRARHPGRSEAESRDRPKR